MRSNSQQIPEKAFKGLGSLASQPLDRQFDFCLYLADVLFFPMLQFNVRNQPMERTQLFLVTWSYNPVEHAAQTA